MPHEALTWIWSLILATIIFVGLNRKSGAKKYSLRPLIVFYFIAISLHLAGLITQKYLGNNYWTYNLYTLMQTGLILYSISRWTQTKWIRLACYTLILINSAILFTEIAPYYPTFGSFADNAILSSGISIVAMLTFFMFELSNTSRESLIYSPLFWISSGFLLYFSISDVLLYTLSLVDGISSFSNVIRLVHIIVYILAAILQLKGFLCLPRR
jgi:hypothetical protein